MDSMSVLKSLIKEMGELRQQGVDIASLGVGVPFYGMPRAMKDYCAELITRSIEIDWYTPFAGLPKLRDVVAGQFEQEMGRPVRREDVLITAGSMSGLYYIFKGLLSLGQEIIVPSPYFLSYKDQVELCGGKIVEVSMADGWKLDIDSIAKAITERTKAIVINSPHNPTGTVYRKDELVALAEFVVKKDLYLITDEAYDFLVYGEYFNLASLETLRGRIIRCGSYSKRFGMTGWRIGYLYAEGEMMNKIARVHDNISVCAPHLGQEAVWYGLTHEIEEMNSNLEQMRVQKEIICSALQEVGQKVRFVEPEGAFYVMVGYLGSMGSVEVAQRLLREARVFVLPGVLFGEAGEGQVRLSFGGRQEEVEEGVKRLVEWFGRVV